MKQEIVLPKFKIPGQTNWLVRGLWIGGGVVVLLSAVVVFALNRQGQLQQERIAAEAQRVQAEQAAIAAAATKPAPKTDRATATRTLAATKAPLPGTALETGKSGALSKPRAGLPGKGKARARAGYTLRKKSTRQSRLYATKAAAKGGARPAPKAKPAGKGGDAIDDILRNFK
jgi:hypothetical protein